MYFLSQKISFFCNFWFQSCLYLDLEEISPSLTNCKNILKSYEKIGFYKEIIGRKNHEKFMIKMDEVCPLWTPLTSLLRGIRGFSFEMNTVNSTHVNLTSRSRIFFCKNVWFWPLCNMIKKSLWSNFIILCSNKNTFFKIIINWNHNINKWKFLIFLKITSFRSSGNS